MPLDVVLITTRVITYTYPSTLLRTGAPLNRLTGAEYSTGEHFEYAYDAMSNMTAMTETITDTVVTTYAYNEANQLVTAQSSDDGITWHYTHDQRGNLLRQTPGGTEPAEGETRYTYNSANQLVRVELYTTAGYVTLAEGVYNAYGERAQLTTWAGGVPQTVAYGVFQGQLLVADDGTQATLHLYPSAPLRAGGWNLIAEYGAEGWSYHLRDGTGSLRQVVDGGGWSRCRGRTSPLAASCSSRGCTRPPMGSWERNLTASAD